MTSAREAATETSTREVASAIAKAGTFSVPTGSNAGSDTDHSQEDVTFKSMVLARMAKGETEGAAVRAMVKAHPKLYTAWREDLKAGNTEARFELVAS